MSLPFPAVATSPGHGRPTTLPARRMRQLHTASMQLRSRPRRVDDASGCESSIESLLMLHQQLTLDVLLYGAQVCARCGAAEFGPANPYTMPPAFEAEEGRGGVLAICHLMISYAAPTSAHSLYTAEAALPCTTHPRFRSSKHGSCGTAGMAWVGCDPVAATLSLLSPSLIYLHTPPDPISSRTFQFPGPSPSFIP
ncbi:hypothetical protein DFH06DRAFT_1374933 [Mycena polygramma]|nr:hypothetical protein DFH06DRAFT_1374933 [Mycena polygramma]